jgi:hypothetical protein
MHNNVMLRFMVQAWIHRYVAAPEGGCLFHPAQRQIQSQHLPGGKEISVFYGTVSGGRILGRN